MLETLPYKLLLIEDDLVDQIAFKRMLKKEGLDYDFKIAGSLAEAKAILSSQIFDLVITDYQLGDGNAVALFDYLKSTPFIFATGGGDEEIAVKALQAGAFDYLIKDPERNYLKVLPLTIENAIKRSKMNERLRLLESVVVHANDGVVVAEVGVGNQLEIMYINHAFTKMTDYTFEEVAGKNFNIFIGNETDTTEALLIQEALLHSESVKSELIFYKKGNIPYWVGVSIVPLKDKNGKTTHFVSILRDISERKKAERELIEARNIAESARLAEQQFLANMSHEIRTPMNAVIGMTHLLLDTNPSEQQLEYLNALKFSADSLMGIISDILDLSKIEAGKVDFEQKQFNLHDLLFSLQKAFEFKLKDKNIRVLADLDMSIENEVIGDPTRLNQILTNLLGNAGKFTLEGEIGIKMRILNASVEKYDLEFSVFDTGIGIESDKLDLVFENFKQANSQIHRKFGGTGLGLSIVKNLVELQGGKIWVNSTIGIGTTFTFTLSFQNSGIHVVAAKNSSSVEDEMAAPNISLNGVKILIAEDNFMNQKLISEIMKKWDCNFDMANDGVEALEQLNSQKYDLILMDVNMPRMDGYQASIELRKNDQSPNQLTPIIALTAAALQSERERVFQSGMNEFVTKPFVPDNLKKTMIQLLTLPSETPTLHHKKEKNMNTGSMSNGTVKVSLDYLNAFSGGDNSFIREMVQLFLTQTPSDLLHLKELCNQNEWEKLGKLAHKMKPNYQMMGMEPQQKLALTIETVGQSGKVSPPEMKTMVEQLVQDTEKAIPLLQEQLTAIA